MAGAIFGVEVLFIGSILYDVLLPSFIASIVDYHISSFLGILHRGNSGCCFAPFLVWKMPRLQQLVL